MAAKTPVTALFLLVAAALLLPGSASARTERLRWSQSKPAEVSRFYVYWGFTSNAHHAQIDVGRPSQSGNIFSFDLVVPDDAEIYVTVRAVGSNGTLSDLSNTQVRQPAAPPAPPPVNPPPTPPVTPPSPPPVSPPPTPPVTPPAPPPVGPPPTPPNPAPLGSGEDGEDGQSDERTVEAPPDQPAAQVPGAPGQPVIY